MTSIFLSYARNDDKPFVKHLYEDLTARGFDVWWDRVSMPARGLTFLHEIRDAIDARERFLLVIGPGATTSDYVIHEWKHAVTYGRAINPILRLGDFPLVPDELKLLHVEDFRDDKQYAIHLENLVRQLSEPVAPMGKLIGVPTLPRHLLTRPDRLQSLKDALLADLQRPGVVTGAAARMGIHGMGGIGKSVLANMLARDTEVRRAFPDGIFWVPLGVMKAQEAENKLMQLQRNVAGAFAENVYFDNVAQGRAKLGELLAGKAVLLILDDVWERAHPEAFDVLGARCRAVITTRDTGLVTSLGGSQHQVQFFTQIESLNLLAGATGVNPGDLRPEAREIVHECGFLPLAVALCAGMVKRGVAWSGILARLKQAALESIADRNSENVQHLNLWTAMKVSVDSLTPDERQRYIELSVFPNDKTVAEAAVRTLWQHTGGLDDFACEDLLLSLSERSLIWLNTDSPQPGQAPRRSVSLHALLYDFIFKLAGDTLPLHNQLLDAYRQKCPEGWHTGTNDGYFFQRLVYHLVQAGKKDEVSALLFDFYWMLAKLKATDAIELMADYDTAQMLFPSYVEGKDKALRLVQGALRLSAHVLTQDKSQLRPHMTGRLLTFKDLEIKALLEQMKQWKGAPWLRPLTPSLMPPGGPLLCTLEGHNSSVLSVMIIADGRRAISASSDNTLKVWDLETGKVLHTLKGHFDSVVAVVVTADGRHAISGSNDKTLKVWDLETEKVLHTLEGHSGSVVAVVVTADGRCAISGSADKTLKVWDLETGKVLHTLAGHSGWIYANIAVTADGRRAISGSYDCTLKVWDMETGKELHTLEGHSNSVEAVAVTADGRRAVSGSRDTTLKVWDLETGKVLHTLSGHSDRVEAVAVTADGRRAISGSWDKTLKVWDLETGKVLHTLAGHSARVEAVAMTVDGRRAISGSNDKTLKVWNLETGKVLNTLAGHSDSVNAVAVTADGRRAVSGSGDSTLKVWDLETGKVLNTLEGHSHTVNAIAETADGRCVISASDDKTLKVWNVEAGKVLHTLEGHTNSVRAVAVTADDRRAISGSWDKTLKVWDLETGKILHTLEDHSDCVEAVTVTTDDRRAISGSWDKTLKVWDLETGKVLRTLEGHSGWVMAVAVTADGRRAISGSWDKTLKVWDLETGKVLHTLKILSNGIVLFVVTADGRCAISESFNTLKVWDLEAEKVLHTLESHTELVGVVVVTANGRHAISGSDDKTLKIWDLEAGKILHTLEGHTKSVRAVAVTTDGRRAISGSDDKTLKVWDLDHGEIIASFRGESCINKCTVLPDGVTVVASEKSLGRMHFLCLENVIPDPPFVTSWRLPDQLPAFGCPLCRTWSEIPASSLGTEIPCPHCGKPVRLNPFTINADWRQVAKAWRGGKD